MALRVGIIAALVVGSMAHVSAEQGSPISKVITLIKELKLKINEDGKAETKLYNKYACWCETTTASKAKAIHQAFADIKSYGTTVLESKAKVGSRTTEVSDLSRTILENEKSQESATLIRQTENGKYEAEKAQMEQTLGALEKGIKALMGAGVALLQDGKAAAEQQMLQAGVDVHVAIKSLPANMPSDVLSPKAMSLLKAFTLDPAASYDAKAMSLLKSGTASGGAIQGILKDMYDTFSVNLEKSTETEATLQKNYENLMAVKAKELVTLKSEKQKKEGEKAEYEGDEAEAATSMDDTRKQMKADVAMFDQVKASCTSKAAEWNERVRARTEELAGIDKALEILDNDPAKDTMGKTKKNRGSPRGDHSIEDDFMQIASQSVRHTNPATMAWQRLQATASKTKSLRLASLAAQLKTGSQFDEVIAGIDKMIATLKGEEKEDFEQRDWCKEETHKNEQEAAAHAYKIEKFEAKLTKLHTKVEELEEVKETVISQIGEATETIKDMEEQRQGDHAAYLTTKEDDEGAADLLASAIDALSAFSKNNKAASLLQREEPDEPEFDRMDEAPKADFSSTSKHAGASSGIVGLMTMIKEDLENEIAFATKGEIKAQKVFMKEVAETKAVIETLTIKKTNLEDDITKKTAAIADTEVLKEGPTELLKEEKEYLASIKPDCDYILLSFETRRTQRAAEVDSLNDAKSMLSAADESQSMLPPAPAASFLQRS